MSLDHIGEHVADDDLDLVLGHLTRVPSFCAHKRDIVRTSSDDSPTELSQLQDENAYLRQMLENQCLKSTYMPLRAPHLLHNPPMLVTSSFALTPLQVLSAVHLLTRWIPPNTPGLIRRHLQLWVSSHQTNPLLMRLLTSHHNLKPR